MRETEPVEASFSVLDNVPMGVFVLQADYVVRFWNRSLEGWTGIPRSRIVGTAIGTHFPHLNDEPYTSRLRPIFDGGRPVIFSDQRHQSIIPASTPGRPPRIQHTTVTALPAPDGASFYALFTIQDVTERKQAEEALKAKETAREAREYAENIVETVREPLLVLDTDLRVNSANHAFYRTFQVTPEQTEGQVLYDLGNRQWNIPALRELLETILPENTFFDDFEVTHRFPELGRRTMLLNARQVYHGEEEAAWILLAIEDITARKQAEEIVKRYTVELERSNQELEQLAYVASHDLQEPLRKITNFTQLLAQRYDGQLDERADTFIGYIVDGAERMRTLINDLLTYSRISTREKAFAPTDLETVLDVALDSLGVAVEESGAKVTREPLPTLMADDGQMAQLFQNLISNAIKFRSEAPPRVHVGAERRQDGWRFRVQDNGIGIDPEYAERIFIIFQRLHGRGEYAGTGIGLAVCKKIVERHGGRIWVESEAGEGATFYFTLAAYEDHQPQ